MPRIDSQLSPADSDQIEERLRNFLESSPRDLAAAYLFGSVARGTSRKESDVDVAVLFREPPPPTLAGLHLDLEADLEELLGLPVQLVVLDRADADLIHNVLRDSRLLVNRDPERRVLFEVQKRNEYFDLLPILRRYRRLEAMP